MKLILLPIILLAVANVAECQIWMYLVNDLTGSLANSEADSFQNLLLPPKVAAAPPAAEEAADLQAKLLALHKLRQDSLSRQQKRVPARVVRPEDLGIGVGNGRRGKTWLPTRATRLPFTTTTTAATTTAKQTPTTTTTTTPRPTTTTPKPTTTTPKPTTTTTTQPPVKTTPESKTPLVPQVMNDNQLHRNENQHLAQVQVAQPQPAVVRQTQTKSSRPRWHLQGVPRLSLPAGN